jgi:hypothetical protein
MVHVYVATALAGYTLGLRREGRTVTVWFYELQLSQFVYGEDKTVQPMHSGGGDTDAPGRHSCPKCKRPRGRPRRLTVATQPDHGHHTDAEPSNSACERHQLK